MRSRTPGLLSLLSMKRFLHRIGGYHPFICRVQNDEDIAMSGHAIDPSHSISIELILFFSLPYHNIHGHAQLALE